MQALPRTKGLTVLVIRVREDVLLKEGGKKNPNQNKMRWRFGRKAALKYCGELCLQMLVHKHLYQCTFLAHLLCAQGLGSAHLQG